LRWLVVIALIFGSRAAIADDKPWAVGVSEADQDAALALYKEGNAFFAQDQFKEALEKYVQALKIWDHPAIRYNAAVCRINLDRPVEAYEDLEAAMRFGEPPLGPGLYKQGLSYQKLLAARIAEVEVTAKSPDSQVSLDGQPVLHGSGTTTRHVLTGDHQVVAEKPGYQTETKPVHVNGGDHVTIVIDLHPLEAARELHRRYPRWVPWATISAGGAVALIGLVPYFVSRNAYDRYDSGVNTSCMIGCGLNGQTAPVPLPGALQTDLDHGSLYKTIAISTFAVGGALVASGVALVVINQPRLVAPIVTGDTVGLAVSGTW
jgi:hypothetical protein